MTQTNDIKLQEGIDYKLLDDARKDRKWSVAQTAENCDVPESTTKSILNGTTLNPGAESLGKLCRTLGVPIEKVLRQDQQKEIEQQGIKENDASVLALKEIYEMQISTMKATNEAHIANIRSHYEQHHKDMVDNFAKIEEQYEKRIASDQEYIEKLESANKTKTIIIIIMAVIFIISFFGLLTLEILHPEHGWIRY